MYQLATLKNPVVLKGKIRGYKARRVMIDFSNGQRNDGAEAIVSVAASALGNTGMAINNITRENPAGEADWVEFFVADKAVKGWVWRAQKFEEWEEVEVVAQKGELDYECFAMLRPADRTISLFPNVVRGSRAFVKDTAWKWLGMTTCIWIFVFAMIGVGAAIADHAKILFGTFGLLLSLGFYAITLIGTLILAPRMMKFVRMAETIFSTLGWPNVRDIDLEKTTSLNRYPIDSVDAEDLGRYYFRY
jgi:hypothetical protein